MADGAYSEASLVALHPAPEQSLQVGSQLLLPQQLHLILLPCCSLLPTPAPNPTQVIQTHMATTRTDAGKTNKHISRLLCCGLLPNPATNQTRLMQTHMAVSHCWKLQREKPHACPGALLLPAPTSQHRVHNRISMIWSCAFPVPAHGLKVKAAHTVCNTAQAGCCQVWGPPRKMPHGADFTVLFRFLPGCL